MWRKSMNYTIEPMIDIGSDRILVIKISGVYCQPVYIINVYLPSANYPIAYYIQIIDELSYIYQLLSETGIVIIAGDMNAQLPPAANTQGRHLAAFLDNTECISLTNHSMCSGPKFTFLPHERCKGTLIDHVCINQEFIECISSCKIECFVDVNMSDHLPILVNIDIRIPYLNVNTREIPCWRRADLALYGAHLDAMLAGIESTSTDTPTNIDEYVNNIVHALTSSSNVSIPKRVFQKHKRPYWDND